MTNMCAPRVDGVALEHGPCRTPHGAKAESFQGLGPGRRG
ncbi:Hypothetical protein AA314_09567 [Archangium gephyra]|uniref:Uncharacterized protein n=1 Tax=Archangium gephyra TaxID=48 RepID=A0AAC8QIY2_9BACT|nr:Hypothetical protein AA314_09567 [Archangium gephyra]